MNRIRRWRAALGLAGLTLLAACGGGSDDPIGDSCSVQDQKTWLRSYMDDWYFWYAYSPSPSPVGYATVDEYFNALLYTGTHADFPSDRWSFTEPTESHQRFYEDGETLGYGVFVTGLEVQGQPNQPLHVRYVEPQSPGALAGIARGDQILAINGRSSADIIAADDFSALSSGATGETLTLALRNASGDRTVTLVSAVYPLVPVPTATTITTATGRRMGYVLVKDMVNQAVAPLDTAFAQFRAAGVHDVVLDLRYNGGGLVSVANTVASLIAGNRASGRVFASLLYNDKQRSNNRSFVFESRSTALGLSRVYVIAGPRTCSASEQVVNALSPFVEVVLVGSATCGKPVGFLPQDHCGTTYNAVNFESVNDRNEGRYFDGFAPTCAATDNVSRALGAPNENLLNTAQVHADTGVCVDAAPTGQRARPLALRPKPLKRGDGGERQHMIPR